jgi:hypothetical protein
MSAAWYRGPQRVCVYAGIGPLGLLTGRLRSGMSNQTPPPTVPAPVGQQGTARKWTRTRRTAGVPTVRAHAVGRKPFGHAFERQVLAQLADSVATLREAVAAQARSTAELRILLQELRQVSGAPRSPGRSAWQQWRESRRGLGASLTLTGLGAIIGGVLLHVVLLHHYIDTTLRLGYLCGLTGLVLLLLGLLIVF